MGVPFVSPASKSLCLDGLPQRTIVAQTATSYQGKIEHPVGLYSGGGILLETGKFDAEVRSEKRHYFLVFLRTGKIELPSSLFG
jgi:hypothetical protein